MPVKTISLEFHGYWREGAIGGIPSKSGIYIVYEAFYNSQAKTVDLKKVIYIGEAEDVNNTISNHAKRSDWKNQCGVYSELGFSFSPMGNPDRERAEAALIYKHRPPVNVEFKYNFPFDETTMNLTGKTALLDTNFTVQRKY
jgi:excinuclease UvrABC nuclease subunit